jgi:hypothetical protein
MLNFLLILGAWWAFCLILLWAWKRSLFQRTWNEPYFADAPVLIESDDWGPGGSFHADRLRGLLNLLSRHRDKVGRCAVLTADTVLSVPDIPEIRASQPVTYRRKLLDESFPEIHSAMILGVEQGTLVPQLHGLEHLNGEAFSRLHANGDKRVEIAFQDDDWWDWESLDSPLQGHYVDGSHLPTTPIDQRAGEEIIDTATTLFVRMFGQPSISTVAPCYLWNSQIEQIWKHHGIDYIQTAGYRCTERDENGNYLQDPPLIRAGDRGDGGQRYLVRNVMYEPTDGRNTPDSAFSEAIDAHKQALPITISTHRYNFTRSESEYHSSLDGLDQLLTRIEQAIPNTRYLASPELGSCMENDQQQVENPFNGDLFPPVDLLTGWRKVTPFLQRLKQRHPKLLILSILTGLVLPAGLLMLLSKSAGTRSET